MGYIVNILYPVGGCVASIKALKLLEGTLRKVFMSMTVVTEVTMASEAAAAATVTDLLDLSMWCLSWSG